MSYSETAGQVTLTMSQADFDALLLTLRFAAAYSSDPFIIFAMVNRLNEGNPLYSPYQVQR